MPIAKADDWPEMQGKGRRSAWDEKGILRKFPQTGLDVQWRVPIHAGYSGPAVADGRVFVSDYQKLQSGRVERVVCLDEQTGRILWTYENHQVAYDKFAYNSGPRATPTVDGDRVYVLGGAGDLYCLNVRTGALRWGMNLPYRFHAKIPTWGFAGAPIVFNDLLICPVGGPDDARIVGFNKLTGREVWHALPPTSDIGYSAPILLTAGKTTQLIHWGPGEIVSLNPETGALYWRQPFGGNLACPTPIVDGDRLFVTAFFDGPLMLKLAADRPAAEVLWQGKNHSEINTDGLHSMVSTPSIMDGYIYGVCSYGQFRCLNATTGERIWESLEVVREKARWASAFLVRNRDVYFINNDRGELIIADLSPKGYHELSRTQLIKPTSAGGGSRELGLVNWTIPAYANRHIITRNDEEIIRASLAE
jgi:outer membrane protein assembly factor BamB